MHGIVVKFYLPLNWHDPTNKAHKSWHWIVSFIYPLVLLQIAQQYKIDIYGQFVLWFVLKDLFLLFILSVIGSLLNQTHFFCFNDDPLLNL